MSYPLLMASDWAIFFGRFHPLLVHLPIGFLLIAALLEIGRRTGKISVSESTVSFILFWSAIGATLSCVAGYMLSLGGGYDEELLSDHKWQGIGVAAFAWIAWAVKSDWLGSRIPFGPAFYLPAFALSLVLTMTAGHDGGSLTHGDGYLTQYTPEPFRTLAGMEPIKRQETGPKQIADINQAVVYQDIVQPILEMKCMQCHNEKKQKGDLRLDQVALMLKGGENGPAFVSGKGAESDMVKRCLLPEADDDHMPPKGKPQLTTDEIALLSWWIDQGAAVDKKVVDLKVTEPVKPALAALSSGVPAGQQVAKSSESAVLKIKVAAPSAKDIEALKKVGLIVSNLAQDQNLLEVSAVNAGSFGDDQIGLLLPLAEQITWLKLGGTKVTDNGLKELAKLKNLSKIHLEHTAVTDAGLANLKSLPYLEYVNVVDTKVSDAGLRDISGVKSLRSVYVWQSAVTDSAVAQVGRQHPGLMVVNGFNEAAVAQFVKAGDTTSHAEPKKN